MELLCLVVASWWSGVAGGECTSSLRGWWQLWGVQWAGGGQVEIVLARCQHHSSDLGVLLCSDKNLTLRRWVAVVRQSSRCRYNLSLQSRKPQLLHQAPVGLRYKSCKDLGRLVLTKFSSSLLPLPNRTIILAKICQIQCNISKHLWEKLVMKNLWKIVPGLMGSVPV